MFIPAADVILPLAVPLLYTYSVPQDISQNVFVGSRVLVQLGNRKMYKSAAFLCR